MKFVGVTRLTIPASTDANLGMPPVSNILLVMETAEQGNLLDYIRRRIAELDFMRGWGTVIGLLSGVANGLKTLHINQFLHRYDPCTLLGDSRRLNKLTEIYIRAMCSYTLSSFQPRKLGKILPL